MENLSCIETWAAKRRNFWGLNRLLLLCDFEDHASGTAVHLREKCLAGKSGTYLVLAGNGGLQEVAVLVGACG